MVELWENVIHFLVGIKNFEMLAFLHAASCVVMIDFKLAGLKLLESPKAFFAEVRGKSVVGFQSYLLFLEKCSFKYMLISQTFLFLQEINDILKVPSFFIKDAKNHRNRLNPSCWKTKLKNTTNMHIIINRLGPP